MASQQHAAAPLGGSIKSPVTLILGVLIAAMAVVAAIRFVFGLGSVTHLNDGYPWGIWVVYDVVIGSALACGGFSMALLVYIFNRGHYHPLVRPALLASLLGYTLAGVGVIFDLGRWWNFWHIFWPGYAQPNSVMFEVAVCISAYVCVLWIEFSPVIFEQVGKPEKKRRVEKMLFFFVALGAVLPAMHQSSLGSLLVVFGYQIHPLWQSILLPLFFLMTAVTMGYAVVIFEACLASTGFRRPLEADILGGVAKVMRWVLFAYFAIRFADLVWRGALGSAFHGTLEALMFWIETACFAVPAVILSRDRDRLLPSRQFVGACFMILGGFFLRINAYLVGYETGDGWHYFPSVPELLVTFGMIAIEVLLYIVIVRRFPVLPAAGHAKI